MSTIDDYLGDLRGRAASITGRPSDIAVGTPQTQISRQVADVHGALQTPSYDQNATFNTQNELTNQLGQQATVREADNANKRYQNYMNNLNTQLRSQAFSVGRDGNSNGGNGSWNGWDDTDYGDERTNNARTIYNIGKSMGIDDNGIRAAIDAGLTESGLMNLSGGDRDSLGIFQQRPSQGWGTPEQIMDPNYATTKFFESYLNAPEGANPWNRIQSVQRSAFPDGSNYAQHWDQSGDYFNRVSQGYAAAQQRSMQRYNQPGGNVSGGGPAVNDVQNQGLTDWINQHNDKYLDYDGAYGAQCVDLYAYYTSGYVGGNPYPVGYAPEIYDNYDNNAYARFGSDIGSRMGDVAVWGRGPYTPYGHVAIVVNDNGDGTLRVLESNATAAGPNGNSIISNISKAALMGYLRPRRLM